MPARKRFKYDVTTIECIPNELFVEIFTYLTDVDTVYAFSRLNQRFLYLTLTCCYSFDFTSVNKTKFDYIIQQHDVHRWQSLRLTEDDHTPGQVMYFAQSFSYVDTFSKLTTLSISNIKSKTASVFVCHLRSFPQLVSLTIGSICGKIIPIVGLSTLKYLTIKSCTYSHWMKNLKLNSLRYTIELSCSHECSLIWPKTLQQVQVSFEQSGYNEIVRESLQYLAQLRCLSICDTAWESSAPDGQIWEQLIKAYLPLLENFRFCFKFWRDFNLTNDINRIVDTFSTPFYLKEKCWFIQCDAQRQRLGVAFLYSLPFTFEHFEIVTNSFDESISTLNRCSTDYLEKNAYKGVKNLTIHIMCQKINQALTITTTNITNLTLKSSCGSVDWIFSMSQLCQLSFGNQVSMSSENFIRLLQNNPHLRMLVIPYHVLELLTNQWKDKTVCHLLTRSIRSLTIRSENSLSLHTYDYLSVEKILHIVRVFGTKCRHLTISLYSRNLIVGFILKNMRQLRSLNVHLQDHDDSRKITKQWLVEQDVTLKNIDCVIVENGNDCALWLGHR